MGLDYDFVKVLDFGLVSFSDPRSVGDSLMTGAHTTTGTPAFMAPEVILEGAVDARADIYALGCVAYYLLTGELVFEADTPMKMFVQHLQTPPMPPSAAQANSPSRRNWTTLVLACLAKDPEERPQTADELLRRLERVPLRAPWTNDAARQWWKPTSSSSPSRCRRRPGIVSSRRSPSRDVAGQKPADASPFRSSTVSGCSILHSPLRVCSANSAFRGEESLSHAWNHRDQPRARRQIAARPRAGACSPTSAPAKARPPY